MTIKNKRKKRYKMSKQFTYETLISCFHNLCNRIYDDNDYIECNEEQYKLLGENLGSSVIIELANGHYIYVLTIKVNNNISKPRLTSLLKKREEKLKQLLNEK